MFPESEVSGMIAKTAWDSVHARGCTYWQMPDDLLDRILRRAAQAKTVLDVGCGKGKLVERLRSRGYDARGMDISSSAVNSNKELSRRGIIKQGDIDDAVIGCYDIIFCNFVISFVEKKDQVLAKMLAQCSTLILSQTVLLEERNYSAHAVRIGMWRNDFLALLEKSGAAAQLLFSEKDKLGALRQVYCLQ